ncbi:MAG: hypothetical protein JST91_03080 [Actinobacteria bacterium]|nr:hypothetical protein [Actinomycetota bacterium]
MSDWHAERMLELAGRTDKYDILWYTESGPNIFCRYDTVEAAEIEAGSTISPAVNAETVLNMPEDLFEHPDPDGPLLYAGRICVKTLHWMGNRYAVIVRSPVNETVRHYAIVGIAGDYECEIFGQPTEDAVWRGLERYVRECWKRIVRRPCADAHGFPMIAPVEPPADPREAIRIYFDAENARTPGAVRCCSFPTPTAPPRPPAGLTLVAGAAAGTQGEVASVVEPSWFLYWDNTVIAGLVFSGQLR